MALFGDESFILHESPPDSSQFPILSPELKAFHQRPKNAGFTTMRLANIFLVAAGVLAGVSAATVSDPNEVSKVTSSEVDRSLVELEDDKSKRYLRVDKTVGKDAAAPDEEKGLFRDMLENVIVKNTYRAWYSAGMTPKEVRRMLRKRAARGRYVNWAIADGYPRYYRRRQMSMFYW